jgi:NADPH-dependent FMN reductase
LRERQRFESWGALNESSRWRHQSLFGVMLLRDDKRAHTKAWSKLISSFAGFVLVFPQYSWGYPTALKNALDYLYNEWRDKPATTRSPTEPAHRTQIGDVHENDVEDGPAGGGTSSSALAVVARSWFRHAK